MVKAAEKLPPNIGSTSCMGISDHKIHRTVCLLMLESKLKQV